MAYQAGGLEGLVMFDDIYKGKRVLVTGHTGFKGSWLCLWLQKLGANICGYSLEPETSPSHFELIQLSVQSEIADIRDYDRLHKALVEFRPEIVFHLAAQAFVRRSYKAPLETFNTNIIGTANVLEACRQVDSVRAVVNITSDKCYENKEWVWGYRESDPMGGFDPYSASKGCAELVISSFRSSYFQSSTKGRSMSALTASARAGNVIGGGDWGEDRLIPDIMRAIASREPVVIRNPQSTRPWQHVLEPLSGYLVLGQRLLEGETEYAGAWNFGPRDGESLSVAEVTEQIKDRWNAFSYTTQAQSSPLHEARLLKLDCSKARTELQWSPTWEAQTAINKTVDWFKFYYESQKIVSEHQLRDYIADAELQGQPWADKKTVK